MAQAKKQMLETDGGRVIEFRPVGCSAFATDKRSVCLRPAIASHARRATRHIPDLPVQITVSSDIFTTSVPPAPPGRGRRSRVRRAGIAERQFNGKQQDADRRGPPGRNSGRNGARQQG